MLPYSICVNNTPNINIIFRMTHGTWNNRTTQDLYREFIIITILFSLYIPTYRHRSYVISILATIAIAQHVHGLLSGSDMISKAWVVCGAWALGAIGFWYADLYVSLCGTYSFISKFNPEGYMPASWVLLDLEVHKVMVSVVVWGLLVATQRLWKAYYQGSEGGINPNHKFESLA